MSRSRRKNPACNENTRGMKRLANQKVRQYKGEIANGKAYRKLFPTYDISDTGWFMPLNRAIYYQRRMEAYNEIHRFRYLPDDWNWIEYWKKLMRK
jgi:hypothetical protein